MANVYEVYQPNIQAPFQQATWGQRWGSSLGLVKDEIIQNTMLGVMARFPQYAPLDALGEIGLERGIYQGPTETTAHYIARLLNAWGAWTLGGSYWGLLAQLYGSGYTTAYIVAANGYIYGPSNGVTAPDPINGIAGNPPAWFQLPPYYATGTIVYPPWNFSSGDAQGQNDTPIDIPFDAGGSPDPEGDFWSRFIVMFDPYPASWTDVVNPPTSSTSPSNAEIALIQSIIAKWKPGTSTCVGIMAANGGTRACWAYPFTDTTNIPFSCWLSRAIVSGDAPTSTAFTQTNPQAVYSWLPNTSVVNAGGSTYIFTSPSSYYQTQNLGVNYVYTSPASSGTTGLVEPSWPVTIGNTVSDNGITWTCSASLVEWTGGAGSIVFQSQES
jgi:hypothetical protein